MKSKKCLVFPVHFFTKLESLIPVIARLPHHYSTLDGADILDTPYRPSYATQRQQLSMCDVFFSIKSC